MSRSKLRYIPYGLAAGFCVGIGSSLVGIPILINSVKADTNASKSKNTPHRRLDRCGEKILYNKCPPKSVAYQAAKSAIERFMVVHGAPGVSVGVSIDGKTVFQAGFGLADVETGARCSKESVMRIASISKCITATIAAELVEAGKLDLDKPISEYLSETEFPKKKVNGKEVQITTRQLLSHMAGIRHYPKANENDPDSMSLAEFMSYKHFKSVTDSLEMFKADDLVASPGEKFHYTTHGFTLASAVLEKASGKEFKVLLVDLFRRLGMRKTYPDDINEKIVAHRTKFYRRNKDHKLENVPEVDNSYKLAGGGILSNVKDLLTFSNAILYSYQWTPDLSTQKPLLRPETVRMLWERMSEKSGTPNYDYGLGWEILKFSEPIGGTKLDLDSYRYHRGGAAGASSTLLIKIGQSSFERQNIPKGICVAILINQENCSSLGLARDLVEIFSNEPS